MAKEEKKEEKQASDSRFEQFGTMVASVMAKELHFDAIQVASEAKMDVPRVPTGIFALDYAMGGGIPVGQVTMFEGHKEGGKTNAAQRLVAHAQRTCHTCYKDREDCKCKQFEPLVCFYIDAEGKFNDKWARGLGVDTTQLWISRPDHLEQMWDIVEKALQAPSLDLLVIDSLAALSPAKEIEKSMEESTVGEAARKNNAGLRKSVMSLNRAWNQGRRITILLINQIRMKVGVMYGNPEVLPGGMGQGFTVALDVKLWAKKRDMDESTHRPLTRLMGFKIEKNQTHTTGGMDGEYVLIQAETSDRKIGEIAQEEYLATMATKYGVIVPEEGKKEIFKFAGQECRGIRGLADLILKSPAETRKLSNRLMEVLLKD